MKKTRSIQAFQLEGCHALTAYGQNTEYKSSYIFELFGCSGCTLPVKHGVSTYTASLMTAICRS